MQNAFLSPAEIAEYAAIAGQKKAELSPVRQLLLGILAGAFIAFGAQGANMAVHTIESASAAKLIAGLIFPAGLIMVIAAGAELFTGNCLMVIALAERRISPARMLRSWCVVYLGNLIGGVFMAVLINLSGQLGAGGGILGGFTINAAAGKTGLTFQEAFVKGVLCNWLVCLAVWMSFGARDGAGKVLVIFFPVWLFVASGFEHSIANMYYIPAGILAKSDAVFLEKAASLGASPEAVANLSWSSMFAVNLLPVTLGNIVGGSAFVGMAYWLTHLCTWDNHER